MNRGPESYPPQVLEAIRRRATELFQSSGNVDGHDLDNWCQAEAEVLREISAHAVRRAVVVNLGGVVYTGEYDRTAADDYTPGEWKPGERVPVRLAGDKLYLLQTEWPRAANHDCEADRLGRQR